MNRLPHLRIEMHRIDEEMVRKPPGEDFDRVANLIESVAEILAPMAGDQDKGARRPVWPEQRVEFVVDGSAHFGVSLKTELVLQCVDDRVARDLDRVV